jgi:hypothetical protein
MIDTFALALTHGLLLLAAWRLVSRGDLDREEDNMRAGGEARRNEATGGAPPNA